MASVVKHALFYNLQSECHKELMSLHILRQHPFLTAMPCSVRLANFPCNQQLLSPLSTSVSGKLHEHNNKEYTNTRLWCCGCSSGWGWGTGSGFEPNLKVHEKCMRSCCCCCYKCRQRLIISNWVSVYVYGWAAAITGAWQAFDKGTQSA